MSKSKLISCVIAIFALAALSFYINRDRFSSEPVQISHRVSPWIAGSKRLTAIEGEGSPVVFSFDNPYRFSEIKVCIAADIETNKYARAMWKLVSVTNSAPTSSFAYGSRVRGMKPFAKGVLPDPLEPGVTYRLMVKIGSREAQHDFTTNPK